MTKDQERQTIIAKARSFYIPKVTNNISVALEMFLKNNATENEKIPLTISRKNKPGNWVDDMGRPKCPKCNIGLTLNTFGGLWQCDLCGLKIDIKTKNCPDCNKPMIVVPVNVSRCTQVDKKYNSAWTCKNEECMNTIYNKKTMQEILMEGK